MRQTHVLWGLLRGWTFALGGMLLAPVGAAQDTGACPQFERALVPAAEHDRPNQWRPAEPAQYHSVGMVAAGALMLNVGVAGVVWGSHFIRASQIETRESCPDTWISRCRLTAVEPQPAVDEKMQTAGIVLLASGLALVAGGIPLIVLGARKETRVVISAQGAALGTTF